MTGEHVSERWAQWRAQIPLEEYHVRWARMEAEGRAAHGEADRIASYAPTAVLDAGCGMGRVAMELHHRGISVDGADLDDELLAYARADAPDVRWIHADLAEATFPRHYDLVAMPGNVMLFCRAEVRDAIVANLARHLLPGGRLVAGFGLEQRPDAITLAEYDTAAEAAGLVLDERFATWEGEPFEGGDYAVSVHRRP